MTIFHFVLFVEKIRLKLRRLLLIYPRSVKQLFLRFIKKKNEKSLHHMII